MNDQGIWKWDADAAVWATIGISVDWTISINVTKVETIGGFLYDHKWTESGSGTVMATFVREPVSLDGSDVTINKFVVSTGEIPVGEPAEVPPFFRSCYAQVTPINNINPLTPPDPDGPIFIDESGAFSIAWTETYTPTDGGPALGLDDSGTSTGATYLQLELHQVTDQMEWTVAFALPGIFVDQPYSDFDGDINDDSEIGPWTVTVHDLLKSGVVDFGGTTTLYNWTGATFWDTVTTFINTAEATVVCS